MSSVPSRISATTAEAAAEALCDVAGEGWPHLRLQSRLVDLTRAMEGTAAQKAEVLFSGWREIDHNDDSAGLDTAFITALLHASHEALSDQQSEIEAVRAANEELEENLGRYQGEVSELVETNEKLVLETASLYSVIEALKFNVNQLREAFLLPDSDVEPETVRIERKQQ